MKRFLSQLIAAIIAALLPAFVLAQQSSQKHMAGYTTATGALKGGSTMPRFSGLEPAMGTQALSTRVKRHDFDRAKAEGAQEGNFRDFTFGLDNLKFYDDNGKEIVDFKGPGAAAYLMGLGDGYGNTGPSVNRVKPENATAMAAIGANLAVEWRVNTLGAGCRAFNFWAQEAGNGRRAWIGHPQWAESNDLTGPYTVLAATDKHPKGNPKFPATIACFDYAKAAVVAPLDKAAMSRVIQPPSQGAPDQAAAAAAAKQQ